MSRVPPYAIIIDQDKAMKKSNRDCFSKSTTPMVLVAHLEKDT